MGLSFCAVALIWSRWLRTFGLRMDWRRDCFSMIEEVFLSSVFHEKDHVMWQVSFVFANVWSIRLERKNRIIREVETSSEKV